MSDSKEPAQLDEVRITLRLPKELHDYLKEAAYQNRTDVTKYINKVLTEDKAAHPEIVPPATT